MVAQCADDLFVTLKQRRESRPSGKVGYMELTCGHSSFRRMLSSLLSHPTGVKPLKQALFMRVETEDFASLLLSSPPLVHKRLAF